MTSSTVVHFDEALHSRIVDTVRELQSEHPGSKVELMCSHDKGGSRYEIIITPAYVYAVEL